VLAFGDEALEVRLRVSNRIRPRYANGVKTLRARLFGERCLNRGRV